MFPFSHNTRLAIALISLFQNFVALACILLYCGLLSISDIVLIIRSIYNLCTFDMSSANCCLNRRPSSPDCPPSRPILRRHFGVRASVLEPALPCTSTTSRLSKPEDIAALQAIFESERSSTESERRRVISKDSSNTLNTVKQKLKKHLSRDSEGSKRLSRSSVGTSEEEIERRAELRRIRQKRIRDELSIEGVYDDDATSLPSIQAPLSASSLLIDSIKQGPPSLPRMSSPSRGAPAIVLSQLQVPVIELSLQHINSSVEYVSFNSHQVCSSVSQVNNV